MADLIVDSEQKKISEPSKKMAPDLSMVGSPFCDDCAANLLLGRYYLCDKCLHKIEEYAASLTFSADATIRRNLVRALMYEKCLDSEPLFVLNDITNRMVLIIFAFLIDLLFRCSGRYPTIHKAKEIVGRVAESFCQKLQYDKTEVLRLIDEEVREAFAVANLCGERNIRYTNDVALINIKKLKPKNFYVITDPETAFSYVVSQMTSGDDGRSAIKFKLIGGLEYMMSRFDWDDPANREICLTEDYYLAETPTTQRQWGALNSQQVNGDEMQTNVSYADLFGSMDWPLFNPWNVSADMLGPCLRTLSQNGIVLSLPSRAQLELVEETLPANASDTFDHLELCMDWRDLESKEWELWPSEREWRPKENVRTNPVGPFKGIRRTLMGYEVAPKEKVFTAVGLGVWPCERIGPMKELFGFRFCVPAVVEEYCLHFVVKTADGIGIECPTETQVAANTKVEIGTGRKDIVKIVNSDDIPVIDPLLVNANTKSVEMRSGDDSVDVVLSKSRPHNNANIEDALENALIEKKMQEHFSRQGVDAKVNIASVEGYPCRRRCAILSSEDVERIFGVFGAFFEGDMLTVWKPAETMDGECCAFEYVLPSASTEDKQSMQIELEEMMATGSDQRFIVPEPSTGSDQVYAPLRYEFYDAIESGEKKVEYREYNAGWAKKLLSRPMNTIKFSRGYGHAGEKPRQMVFAIVNIGIVDANSETEISSRHEDGSLVCDADVEESFMPTHFAIHLGERLS